MVDRLASLGRSLICPRVFLAGFAAGLLACALLGRQVAHEGYYRNFVRMGGPYQVDNTFMLSPSQMRKLIASECSRDHVLVLVGGSSVMMGVGQPVRHLWSRKLNDVLGSGYCVYNLAGPSGVLNGIASTTLAMLGRDYKRSYLVSDMTETSVRHSPDGVLSQKYYFWDAYYKGLMDPGTLAKLDLSPGDVPPGGRAVSAKDAARAEQLRLGARLDSALYFNDLWSYMHFNFFTTYYFHNAGAYQWTPRRIWPDYDFEVDFDALRGLRQYTEAVGSPAFERNIGKLRSSLNEYFDHTPEGLALKEPRIAAFDALVRNNLLDATRQNVLMVYIGVSPHYMDHVGGPARNAFELLHERQAAIFERHGFHVARPRLGAEDYSDLIHLNALGGRKLAETVADRIRSLEAGR